MTDQPGRPPEERLPAPRAVEPHRCPPRGPVQLAALGTRKFELTPERAAGIVRQSANARWVGVPRR